MQRSLPTKLTAKALSVGLSPAYCWTLFINFMKQLNWLLPLQRSKTQHTFVGFNDGVPVAYPVLSFDFLIRRWMWLFMDYICAHLNYINSGQIFHLNVKDVKQPRNLIAHVVGVQRATEDPSSGRKAPDATVEPPAVEATPHLRLSSQWVSPN